MVEHKYKKVVYYSKLNRDLNGWDLIEQGIFTLIPFINIIMGLILIVAGLTYRNSYYKRIK